ncbi:MAG: NADPH:quinone oxidoreductase family protein [Pseudomonadota bacterium]
MRAVLCEQFGPAEELTIQEIEAPAAKPGHVVVDVRSAALNFPDVLMVQGKYQSLPDFPFSPGGEFSGVISSVGEEVSGWSVGDEVFGGTGHGCFAEQISVPAKALRAKPQALSFAQASGISTTYGTSYYALKQRADLKQGETLLVLGAAGGVGLAAVELGKAMGARVIAAASSRTKLDIAAQAGADELIDYSDGELKEKVKALTDGRGADVIYDPVGGDFFEQCLRCVNWYGRVLVVGFVGGDIPRVPTNLILLKSCQIVGVFYGAWTARAPQDNEQNFQEILQMVEAGKLKPLVGREYQFEEYAAALNCLDQRQALGKVVLNIQT